MYVGQIVRILCDGKLRRRPASAKKLITDRSFEGRYRITYSLSSGFEAARQRLDESGRPGRMEGDMHSIHPSPSPFLH